MLLLHLLLLFLVNVYSYGSVGYCQEMSPVYLINVEVDGNAIQLDDNGCSYMGKDVIPVPGEPSGLLVVEEGNYLTSFSINLVGTQQDTTLVAVNAGLSYEAALNEEIVSLSFNQTVVVSTTRIFYGLHKGQEVSLWAGCGVTTGPIYDPFCKFGYYTWNLNMIKLEG